VRGTFCIGYSERVAGTRPPARCEMRAAVRDGDGTVINGSQLCSCRATATNAGSRFAAPTPT